MADLNLFIESSQWETVQPEFAGLYVLENWWLIVVGDNGLAVLLGDDLAALAVHLKELWDVESWLLQDLDLLDVDLVEGVGWGGGLGDVGGHWVGEKLGDDATDIGVGNLKVILVLRFSNKVIKADDKTHLTAHDVHHLLADGVDLGGLGVGGLLNLVLSSLGETNTEEAELVAVGGGAVDVGLDLGLPLLDDGALLVTGQLHTVEVGEASITLDLLADETEMGLKRGKLKKK